MGTVVPVVFVIVFDASLIVRSGCSQLSPRFDPIIARVHQPSALRGTFERTLNTGGKPVLDRCKEHGFQGQRAEAVSYTHLTLPTILRV